MITVLAWRSPSVFPGSLQFVREVPQEIPQPCHATTLQDRSSMFDLGFFRLESIRLELPTEIPLDVGGSIR